MAGNHSARMDAFITNGLCITGPGGGAPEYRASRLDIGIKDGKIAELLPCGPGERTAPSVTDAQGCLIVPGFVNSHTHSPDNIIRGTAPDLPLELWSLKTSPGRDRRTPREVYVSALLGSIDLLRSGSTTVLDHIRFNPDIDPEGIAAVCRAYEDAGIRAVVAPIVADKRVVDTMPFEDEDFLGSERPAYGGVAGMPAKEQAAIVEAFIKETRARASLVTPAVAPSGPQRCSDELLSLCAALIAQYRVPMHTHLLETKVQLEMARRLYGGSMVSHIDSLGLLTKMASLAHVVYATPDDLELIATRGASVVHNPVSNTRLGGGVADVPGMVARGINVALGTDSSTCNDSNNMLETAKLAAILHNLSSADASSFIGPQRALAMATAGGGRALGLGKVTGRLAEGFAADLTLIRLAQPALVPLNDPVRQLVLGGAGMAVDTVMVAGRVVVSGGRCVLVDEEAIWREAAEFAEKRLKDAAGSFKNANALATPITRMYDRVHGLKR
jgi:5-methylthioadenosine/S-adenosylhomocysteine deaminase